MLRVQMSQVVVAVRGLLKCDTGAVSTSRRAAARTADLLACIATLVLGSAAHLAILDYGGRLLPMRDHHCTTPAPKGCQTTL